MNTDKDPNQNHLLTSTTRTTGDIVGSTLTNIPSVLKHPHENTIIPNEANSTRRISSSKESYQQFSTTLLRNKTLLVPTRLALKRQRSSVRTLVNKSEPISTNTIQMELGNRDELKLYNDNDEQYNILNEQNRIQSRSNNTSPVRRDGLHTTPTDISLLYREKPLFSHPVTGQYIVQYTEENGNPSPCSYVLPRTSLREKTAPSYTFGARCLVEKKGGARTAWDKQWFAHSNPYTTKVDFHREAVWPTPFHYTVKPSLGTQPTKVSFPSWSIGARLQTNPTVTVENNPSPHTYDTVTAFKNLTATNTHITLKSRSGGTQISTIQPTGRIPGPNAYDNRKFLSNKHSAPKHSFGKRIPTSYTQDPYVTAV